MLSKAEKQAIREHVLDYYESRNGRNVRICADGSVTVDIDGDGSQVINGRDVSGGRIFAGWDVDLLAEARRE